MLKYLRTLKMINWSCEFNKCSELLSSASCSNYEDKIQAEVMLKSFCLGNDLYDLINIPFCFISSNGDK